MVSLTHRFFAAVPRRALVALFVLHLALGAATPAADCGQDVSAPQRLHTRLRDGDRFAGLRLRGALRLAAPGAVGEALHGLSGLAWDADDGRLYALSDFGQLVHLRPRFADGVLVGVDFCGAHALLGRAGERLPPAWADAEGLALRNGANGRRGDGQLLVAFERVPRIEVYSTTGVWSGAAVLPPGLRAAAYAGPNQALESLGESQRFGLTAAPERPLRGVSEPRLYARDGQAWPLRMEDARHGGLVDLAITGDDQFLLLTRRYVSIFQPLVIGLERLEVADDGRALRQFQVARFDSSAGWSLDNFEGLARHEGERYFLVSDDNRHPLELTLLMYVEVMGAAGADPGPPPSTFMPR